MDLKVGDKVYLRKNSIYYNERNQIPPNGGVIISIEGSHYLPVRVSWEDGNEIYVNSYDLCDLYKHVLNTELARVLYPEAKVSKCGEWLEVH